MILASTLGREQNTLWREHRWKYHLIVLNPLSRWALQTVTRWGSPAFAGHWTTVNMQNWLFTLKRIFYVPTRVCGEIKFLFHESWGFVSSNVSKENCRVDYWFIGICLVETSVLIRDSDFLIFRLFRERYSNVGQDILKFLPWPVRAGRVEPRGEVVEADVASGAFLGSLPGLFSLGFHPLFFTSPLPPPHSPSKPRPFSVLFGEEPISGFRLGCECLGVANG